VARPDEVIKGLRKKGWLERAAWGKYLLLYRRWLKQGEAAFQAVSSSVFADALASGTVRVECLVLSQTYRHLSLVGNLVRSWLGLKRGERHWLSNAKRPGLAQSPL
jgi:hypothetical protein